MELWIFELKKKTMTQTEQWYADRKRYNEVMAKAEKELNQGNYQESVKLFKNAQRIASSLAREIKKGDQVIKTTASSTAEAIALVERAGKQAEMAERKHRDELEKRLRDTKAAMEEVRANLDKYSNKLEELQNTPLERVNIGSQME